jgi:hypothetical protein
VSNEGSVLSLDGKEILQIEKKRKIQIRHNSWTNDKQNSFHNTMGTRIKSYHKGQVADFDVFKRPLSKKLDGGCRFSHGVLM